VAEIDLSASAGQLAKSGLFSQIDQALRATGYSPLLNLRILETQGTVVLRGVVPSYYMKQIAQEAVSAVPGIAQVHNLLDVACGTRA
jgi:osmotically-inducible protein OsmY